MLIFLPFAEFKLKAPHTQKRCITQEFPFPALRRHLGALIIKIAEISRVKMLPLKNAKLPSFYLIVFFIIWADIINGALLFSAS